MAEDSTTSNALTGVFGAPGHPEGGGTSTSQPFGANLEPVLLSATEHRLSAVSWFRTDWQRGGALTGYATYRDDDGKDQAVVVKLPVPPGESQWLVRLQSFDHVVPRVLCHGQMLGGYDMAWVIMERLPHGPLGSTWDGKEFDLLVEAAARFYAATASFPPGHPHPPKDWHGIVSSAREQVRERDFPEQKRWTRALKKGQQKLKQWVEIWQQRPTDQWCHGDLHLRNAMTRVPAPGGPALLFDLALTHTGHWVEDAIYFEHLYWASRDRLQDRKLARMIAQQRRVLGLPVASDWSRLADVRRALLAMATPTTDSHPRHLMAALEVLEAAV